MNEKKPSMLLWARKSLIGHIVLLQFIWFIPFVIVAAGLYLFAGNPTHGWIYPVWFAASVAGLVVWIGLFIVLMRTDKTKNR